MRPFIPIIVFLFIACNESSVEQKSLEKGTSQQTSNQDTFTKVDIPDTTTNATTKSIFWIVDFDSKTKKRNLYFKKEFLNVDTLIKGLNESYPNIKLEKVKISGDTLFTKIIDSEYLRERMGSSGAAFYLAEVIINLTSVDKIKYVKIDFVEGSHASPGIWNAKDFSDYKELR